MYVGGAPQPHNKKDTGCEINSTVNRRNFCPLDKCKKVQGTVKAQCVNHPYLQLYRKKTAYSLSNVV